MLGNEPRHAIGLRPRMLKRCWKYADVPVVLPLTTVNGLYKAEVIWRRGPWRSLEQVEFHTLEWVDWFNNRRLLERIGNIPPAEAEARYYAQIEEPAMAA